jgi:hypothetical protein
VALAEEYAIRLALQIQQDIAPLSAAASRHGNCNTMNSLVQRRFDETLVQFVQANVHLDEQSRHGTLDGACWLCR